MFGRVLFSFVFVAALFSGPFALKPPVHTIKEPPCEPRAVLASAEPCGGCGNVFISASLLYWQSKMWGLEFATKSFVPNTAGSANQTFEGKLYVPDFAWKPGVKIVLGSHLPFDGWDLRAGWTYHKNECTSLKKHFASVTQPDGIGIIPLWQYPFLQIVGGNGGNPLRYGTASGNWEMKLNAIDLELGRSFFPEESIPMRLKIGAKIASIEQKAHAEYGNGTTVLAFGPQDPTPSLFQFVSSQFQVKTDQWGLGPRLGLESRWNMWRGFNLIGHGAFSILCSFFHLTTKYDDVILPTPVQSKMAMREKFRELTPIVEAMLGLDWGMCFCKNLYFGATLGYEWQYWWSINHARRNYVQTLPGETFDMRGELQMQGLNAAVKFDF